MDLFGSGKGMLRDRFLADLQLYQFEAYEKGQNLHLNADPTFNSCDAPEEEWEEEPWAYQGEACKGHGLSDVEVAATKHAMKHASELSGARTAYEPGAIISDQGVRMDQ